MSAPRGTLLHESGGAFNPGWLLVLVFAAVGMLGCVVAFWIALGEGAAASVLIAIALGFVAFMVITAATMVLSLARVRVLHDSPLLAKLAPGADEAEPRRPAGVAIAADPLAAPDVEGPRHG